jgi:hypothetical protein
MTDELNLQGELNQLKALKHILRTFGQGEYCFDINFIKNKSMFVKPAYNDTTQMAYQPKPISSGKLSIYSSNIRYNLHMLTPHSIGYNYKLDASVNECRLVVSNGRLHQYDHDYEYVPLVKDSNPFALLKMKTRFNYSLPREHVFSVVAEYHEIIDIIEDHTEMDIREFTEDMIQRIEVVDENFIFGASQGYLSYCQQRVSNYERFNDYGSYYQRTMLGDPYRQWDVNNQQLIKISSEYYDFLKDKL